MIISEKLENKIKELCKEVGIDISKKFNENEENITYKEINIYDKIYDDFTIDFNKFYELIPIFKFLERISDIELPSEFPLGAITEERKDLARKMKAYLYCFVISLYVPEIIWNEKDGFILEVPEKYLN